MTMKEEKPIFVKTLILIGVILLVETVALTLVYRPSQVSGFAVIDVTRIYAEMHPSSRLFLIVQWSLIALILLVVFFKNRGILKRKQELSGVDVKSAMRSSKTNLDALFLILKDKREMSVRSVARLFDISEDLAVEWARILEVGELVTIDYPAIGGPVVRLREMPDSEVKNNPVVGQKKGDAKQPMEKKAHLSVGKGSSHEKKMLLKRSKHIEQKKKVIEGKRVTHVLKKVKKLKKNKKKK